MSNTSRRGFITGCSAAVAAYAGTNFNTLAFGDPAADNQELLVSVFLRGGIDGLNLVPVMSGPDRSPYLSARPNIFIPNAGPYSAVALDGQFGFHRATHSRPSGIPLSQPTFYDLFQDGKVSVVLAAGMHEDNRSHFDSMGFMELGTPGTLSTGTGWLTRHLLSAGNLPSEIVMPSLAVGNLQQDSLRGSLETVNMSDPDSFSLNVGPWEWRNAQRTALRNLYSGGSTWLHQSGSETLDAVDIIELNGADGDYTPANGAVYPNTSLGRHFETIAAMAKLDLGLRVATVDFGGWDTHNEQGRDGEGYFYFHVEELTTAMAAFYRDMDGSGANNYADRLTVVVMSEFGRRLRENDDRGTDHGHGGFMLVMSGNAIGGVHGTWPGLSNAQLFDGADLEVTTDYRRVLSEILIRRMGNNQIGEIFPGYSGYTPLGVVNGVDLPPGGGDMIFTDGFESGGIGGWTGS